MRRFWIGFVLAVIASTGLVLAPRGLAQSERKPTIAQFMRPKLEHSKQVLEGLARADFALITRGAQAMKDLSQDAEWRVTQNVSYLRLSLEFQRVADDLIEKAAAKNLDGATLAYLRLTVSCVECHRFLRDGGAAQKAPSTPAR